MMGEAVIGIIITDDPSTVIAIKRRDVPMWVFPGGGVEIGETPEEAVIREIKEETGIHASIIRKAAEYFPVSNLAEHTHVFLCSPIEGDILLSDETADAGYFPIRSLPSPFFFVHKIWINEALNNRDSCIKRPLTEVTYLALFKYFLRHPLHVLRFALSRLGIPLNSKQKF